MGFSYGLVSMGVCSNVRSSVCVSVQKFRTIYTWMVTNREGMASVRESVVGRATCDGGFKQVFGCSRRCSGVRAAVQVSVQVWIWGLRV